MTARAMNAKTLESAFHAFNQHSSVLEASYRGLQARIESLTAELAEANVARRADIAEKERLGSRLSHLLETLPGAVIVIDGEGIIRETNSKAPELLDRPLLGQSWSSIVRREFFAGTTTDGDLELRDGRWLGLSRRRLQSEPGEILLLTEVTERHRMSELLQRHQRLSCIGEMTAQFAHQVRTPLASAMLYASQLERSTAARRKVADRINARLSDLGRMVDDMLGYAGGASRSEAVVRVADLLQAVQAAIEPQLEAGGTLRISLADPALLVEANADAMQGALLNLVNNAIQACADNAEIELGAMQSANQVVLTVTDNGHGIEKAIRPRLFEPFFTTRPQGTGLGLAVVQSVVSAHNGEVLVDSGPRGTTFALCLPACGDDE